MKAIVRTEPMLEVAVNGQPHWCWPPTANDKLTPREGDDRGIREL